jgi:hypothetical protein
MCGLGCGCVEVLPLLGGFSCPVCLQHLRKIFTLKNTCYLLPPSSCHLGKTSFFFFNVWFSVDMPDLMCLCFLGFGFFFFLQHWGLNSGPYLCYSGTLTV